MILALAAASISIACVAASARRVVYATAPTPFDATLVRAAVDRVGKDAVAALVSGSDWEADVFAASRLEGDVQAAHMNEALREIDHRLATWSRVPRVCASIASSTGFLCGAIALRIGLGRVDLVPDAAIDDVLHGAVGSALGVAAVGMAAAIACISLDAEARKAARAKRLAADLLVERLERV